MNKLNEWNTIEELLLHFSDEQVCVSYLYNIKWPHGFKCPRCDYSYAYIISTRRLPLYECGACKHHTSLTTDTIMENSRTSLQKWITAIWLVSQHNININTVQLSSIIQVTYKTAWSILHKIRAIISASDNEQPLKGVIQGIVDYHGKPYFRSTMELLPKEHPLIVAASMDTDEQMVCLKMKRVDRQQLSGRTLRPIVCSDFINHHTCTDISSITIIPHPYRAIRFRHLKKVFQQARSWMIDTFQGIGPKYLQRYLDEFCFRFNSLSKPYSAWDQLISLSMSTHYNFVSRHHTMSSVYVAA